MNPSPRDSPEVCPRRLGSAGRSLPGIAALLLLVVPAGCVVPAPSTSRVAPGIAGSVFDADSGRPVQGARIEHRFDRRMHATATSGAGGGFAVGELRQRHWGLLVGLALNHPLPYRKVPLGGPSTTELSVTHRDYHPHRQQLTFGGPPDPAALDRDRPDQTVFIIELTPLEHDGPAAADQ